MKITLIFVGQNLRDWNTANKNQQGFKCLWLIFDHPVAAFLLVLLLIFFYPSVSQSYGGKYSGGLHKCRKSLGGEAKSESSYTLTCGLSLPWSRN